jgi:hypothetical protein
VTRIVGAARPFGVIALVRTVPVLSGMNDAANTELETAGIGRRLNHGLKTTPDENVERGA